MVFFDLPVVSKIDRMNYTQFRKFLINDGYSMLQYSVYGRVTRNRDDAKKHTIRLKRNLPPKGQVRVLLVTENQYNSMEILVGEETAHEKFLNTDEVIEL